MVPSRNLEVTNGKKECPMLIVYSFFAITFRYMFMVESLIYGCLTNEPLIRQKLFNITYRIYKPSDFPIDCIGKKCVNRTVEVTKH